MHFRGIIRKNKYFNGEIRCFLKIVYKDVPSFRKISGILVFGNIYTYATVNTSVCSM